MNRVIMAQCESCCRKRERLSEEENKMRLRALRQIELDTPQRFSVCVRVFVQLCMCATQRVCPYVFMCVGSWVLRMVPRFSTCCQCFCVHTYSAACVCGLG